MLGLAVVIDNDNITMVPRVQRHCLYGRLIGTEAGLDSRPIAKRLINPVGVLLFVEGSGKIGQIGFQRVGAEQSGAFAQAIGDERRAPVLVDSNRGAAPYLECRRPLPGSAAAGIMESVAQSSGRPSQSPPSGSHRLRENDPPDRAPNKLSISGIAASPQSEA